MLALIHSAQSLLGHGQEWRPNIGEADPALFVRHSEGLRRSAQIPFQSLVVDRVFQTTGTTLGVVTLRLPQAVRGGQPGPWTPRSQGRAHPPLKFQSNVFSRLQTAVRCDQWQRCCAAIVHRRCSSAKTHPNILTLLPDLKLRFFRGRQSHAPPAPQKNRFPNRPAARCTQNHL